MRTAVTIVLILAGSLASSRAAAAQDDAAAVQRGEGGLRVLVRHLPWIGSRQPGHDGADCQVQAGAAGVLEERTDLTPPLIRFFVRNGVSIMPFFRKTEVSDEDLDAMVAYLTRIAAARAAEAAKR